MLLSNPATACRASEFYGVRWILPSAQEEPTLSSYDIYNSHQVRSIASFPSHKIRIMSKTSPVILILGAGPNIGQNVGRAFAAKGYRVALAARKASEAHNTADEIHIQSDFTDSGAVVNAFSKVKSLLGIPSVVVYNGVHRQPG